MLDMGFCAIGSHGLPPRPEVPIRGSSFHCSSQERAMTREYGPLAGLRPRPAPSRTSTPRATTTALGSGGKTPTASAFPGWKFLLRLGFCPSGSRSLSPRPEGPIRGSSFHCSSQERAVTREYGPLAGLRPRPAPTRTSTPRATTTAPGSGGKTPTASAFPGWEFLLRLGFCPSGSGSLSPRPEGPFLGLIFVFRLKNEAWHESTAH